MKSFDYPYNRLGLFISLKHLFSQVDYKQVVNFQKNYSWKVLVVCYLHPQSLPLTQKKIP